MTETRPTAARSAGNRRRIPLPGQRIIRTVISVWLCFLVYELRGRQGLPVFSAIAVIQSIQPYTKQMKALAKEKVFGTVIGGLWGIVMITLELGLLRAGMPEEYAVHYVLVGLFTGVTIYSTVLLHATGMASLAAVVFLCVAINHIQGANAYLYAFNRLLDTVIGLLIAEVVNRVQLPRSRDRDTLFVSGLGHTILREDNQLSPYSRVELNRLIEDGAKFTVSTRESQATVRERLAGVELRYPIITLDGAALYDMGKMEYLCTVPMAPDRAERIITWAREEGLPFFCNIIRDDLLIIRYRDLANDAMRTSFEKRRPSPYRNYVKSGADEYEDVIYLTILDWTERIVQAEAALRTQSWAGDYKIDSGPYEFSEGFSYLRIYDAAVSRRGMLRKLEERMGTRRTVTFGCVPGEYDVVISDADRNTVVKQLRRRYEPVDLRAWRTMWRK